MPVQYGLIAQTTDRCRFDVFHRRQHGTRTPDLNATDRVFSCGLEIAQMVERRCRNVVGFYHERRVILLFCKCANTESWIWITKPSESGVDKFACRRSVPTSALSVEGPAKNKLCRTRAAEIDVERLVSDAHR